ncbi:MAG: integrase, partial [Acetobacteraceae bacterium]
MEKITKRTVAALKPSEVGVKGSEQLLWDPELRGFGVRASPAAAPEPDRNAITVSALSDWYLAEAEAGRILGRRRPIKASTL